MTNLALQKLAIKLIKQPSTYPKHQGCCKIITKFLEKLHFIIELMHFQDTTNIWAYQEKKRYTKTLLFLGHTDVVTPGNLKNWNFPPFGGIIHNNVLYGRGASDMKGAIAAMLIAVHNFIQKYPNHTERIAFIFTSDEEGSGKNGTIKVIEQLVKRNEKIDYCIVGEPSSHIQIGDVIKNGRRGSLMVKLKIQGIQGHVAYPQFSQNPIHLILPVLSTILTTTSWDDHHQTSKKFPLPPTTIQITDINTNNKNNNIVPEKIELNFNFRFNNHSSVNNIKRCMNKILTHYKLKYHIAFELSAEPYFSNPGKLANIITQVIKNQQKITPIIETTGGTSDGRFVAKTGAEIIELGTLHQTIHKTNECIHLTDLKKLNTIYQEIIEKLFIPPSIA